MRRYEEYVGKTVMRMDVEGRRRKGRPKRRWMDSENMDLGEKGQSGRRSKAELCEGNWSERKKTDLEVEKVAMEEELELHSYR